MRRYISFSLSIYRKSSVSIAKVIAYENRSGKTEFASVPFPRKNTRRTLKMCVFVIFFSPVILLLDSIFYEKLCVSHKTRERKSFKYVSSASNKNVSLETWWVHEKHTQRERKKEREELCVYVHFLLLCCWCCCRCRSCCCCCWCVRFVSFHFVSVIINAIVTVKYFFSASVPFARTSGRPIKSEINEK